MKVCSWNCVPVSRLTRTWQKEIAGKGVILLMGVDAGFEIDGLIEIAQVIVEENGG